ncbi:MAG: CDP-glycerol glycerophosphotransferase family protein [Aeromicrobium sp.]
MASEPGTGFVRRLRVWSITRLRRSRFLPVSVPDKVADEQRLGRSLSETVMVYFATGQDTLYQLRPWYAALEALNTAHAVVVVFRDSRTARIVDAETTLDCITLADYGQLDAILAVSDVKLALYVNHDPINFECLRFTSLAHVYLGHGDSDKSVFVSNQLKAYDFYLVAGQAAIARVQSSVMFYDAAARCLPIGQPQLDIIERHSRPPARPVVLYAPTWEGSQPSVAYSSLQSHGPALVDSILASRDFDLIYRPHPFTGNVTPAFATTDAAIRAKVAAAGQRVDTTGTLADAIAGSSVLITDVSAVTSFWLPTGRPVLVTEPSVAEAQTAPGGISARLPRLAAANAGNAAAIVTQILDSPPDYADLVEHHLGDVSPGAATATFVSTCTNLIGRRDAAWAELASKGAIGP